MLAKLRTFSLVGIEALPVEVEVDVSPGAMPKTVLVGLPEAAVKESTHRVERAMVNSGYLRPDDRVVINLAPAELPKQAASFDLPITLGMLAGSGQIASDRFERYAVVGELRSTARPGRPAGHCRWPWPPRDKPGVAGLVVPTASAAEAAVVEGVEVIAVSSLAQAVAFFTGAIEIDPTPPRLNEWFEEYSAYDVDFADVRGQEMAKRAVTIAAAGNHNLLMLGPPGSGKTMLAKRVPTILPQLTAAESIETTRIYSAMGLLKPGQPLLATRPYRAPHHTISEAGLVGGGSTPTPGEIIFGAQRRVVSGRVARVQSPHARGAAPAVGRRHGDDLPALSSTTFPAGFMLIAALNPCPCGYRNDPRRDCHCTVPQIERYMAKISGPLLDRIDIQIEVPAVPFRELSATTPGTSSSQMREAWWRPARFSAARFAGTSTRQNGQMTHRQIRTFCPLDDACMSLLRATMTELGLSARAHDKILRLARTIADLDASRSHRAGPHQRGDQLPHARPQLVVVGIPHQGVRP